MPQVTIVMYHYVRELSLTRYPEIKGLRVSEFKNQLDYLGSRYNFVTVEECIEAIYNPSADFPDNAVLLTFDDGYIEHFTEVFPVLDAKGIQGAFFPPVQAIMDHKVLDVNKIHFVLASANNPKKLVRSVNSRLKELAQEFGLEQPEYYFNKLGNLEHRFDPPEIVYIKRLLQRELPEEPRKIIVDKLFAEYVGVDEITFAKELYLSVDQIKTMLRHGMFFGGHGYAHKWLNAIGREEQQFEVQKTKEFLEHIGAAWDAWVMCYPYGAHNQSLIDLLKVEDCIMGLGTEVGIADLSKEAAFSLKRMDTNDFPKKKLSTLGLRV